MPVPKLQRSSKAKIIKMMWLTIVSILLVFVNGSLLFIMMAVSSPVYITIPITQSVFFNLQPRRIMFFLLMC